MRSLHVSESYHIRIAKERLVFSAAHFITFNGNVCERLHGHNYLVTAEIHGPLDENFYVVDFIAIRDALQAIVDRLDHRVLLPTQHPTIRVADEGGANGEVTATHDAKRWVFPRGDFNKAPLSPTLSPSTGRGRIQRELLKRLGQLVHNLPVRGEREDA